VVLHDADGFKIEEPQNEPVALADIHVQRLAGRVLLDFGDDPVQGATVELRRVGRNDVVGMKSDASGAFEFEGIAEGKYKFKVTEDGI
jgi:hypothetical protein